MLASDAVAKARPDGNTLLLNWHQAIIKALMAGKPLPYDHERDLLPVTRIATGGNVLIVNHNVPAKNLAGFITWMRANPGTITASTGGYGSSPHIALAAFEQAAGVKFNTVHYKGGGTAVQPVPAAWTPPSASPQAFAAEVAAEAPVLEKLMQTPGAKVD